MKWKSASSIAAGLLAVGAQAFAGTADFTASIRLDGTVCYSCAHAVRKNCEIREIGKEYRLDLEEGRFHIKLSPKENVPTPDTFKAIVRDAGFTYRSVDVSLWGQIVPVEGDGFGLLMPMSHQVIPIADGQYRLADLAGAGWVQAQLRGVDAKTWTVVSLKEIRSKKSAGASR